jgi:hypothetical protein
MLKMIEIDGDRMLIDPDMVAAAMEAKVNGTPACLIWYKTGMQMALRDPNHDGLDALYNASLGL